MEYGPNKRCCTSTKRRLSRLKEIRVKSTDTLYLIFPDITYEYLNKIASKESKGKTILIDKEPIVIIKENE